MFTSISYFNCFTLYFTQLSVSCIVLPLKRNHTIYRGGLTNLEICREEEVPTLTFRLLLTPEVKDNNREEARYEDAGLQLF